MFLNRICCLSRRSACLVHLSLSILINVGSFIAAVFKIDYIPNVNSPIELGVLLCANILGIFGIYKRKPFFVLPQMCLELNQMLFYPTWITMKSEALLNYLQIEKEMEEMNSNSVAYILILCGGAAIGYNACALFVFGITFLFDNYTQKIEERAKTMPFVV